MVDSNIMARKNINVKEFVEYLNHTMNMFDGHITEEELANKESNINKLICTLFHMYENMSVDERQQQKTHPKLYHNQSVFTENDIEKIVNVSNIFHHKMETHKENPKWENKRNQPMEISYNDYSDTTEIVKPSRTKQTQTHKKTNNTHHAIADMYEPEMLSTDEAFTSVGGIKLHSRKQPMSTEQNKAIDKKIDAIKKMMQNDNL